MNSVCNLTSQLKNAIKSNQKFVYFQKHHSRFIF
jgi:hypothetical protein